MQSRTGHGKYHTLRKISIELENCSNVVISKRAMVTKRAMAAATRVAGDEEGNGKGGGQQERWQWRRRG